MRYMLNITRFFELVLQNKGRSELVYVLSGWMYFIIEEYRYLFKEKVTSFERSRIKSGMT